MDDDEDTLEEFEADSPDEFSEFTMYSPSEVSKSPSVPISAPENVAMPETQRDSTPVEEPRESLEEKLSKSQEEVGKSEDLGLSDKRTSLDRLSKEKAPKTSKMHRQCHRRFREIIGKRELKNEELEKQQGGLKERLNILECSMPAVMVWNIWRMSQGGCVPNLKRMMEKQFQGPASGEVYCPRTPSRHFDCRVREVEAERKQTQKKIEEAKRLWAEKVAVLEEKSTKLEEARRMQEETKQRIEKLTAEAKRLREAAEAKAEDGSCETGDCGAIECKKKWLEKVPSSASIKSTDLECLQKLQQLAENEVYMKRQIAELESREEAYMRTLQQADELWCKLEDDASITTSVLQEQLDAKTAANQQMADRICELEDAIEQLRSRLSNCRGELEKYLSVSKIEALIGRDDDFVEVLDKEVPAVTEMREEMVGREDDMVHVEDVAILSKEITKDRDVLAVAEVTDVDLDARPDMVDVDLEMALDVAEVGLEVSPDVADFETSVHPVVDDAQMAIHPDDFAYEDDRLREASAYLARLGSLSELDKYGDDYVCDSDFVCNDMVLSESGLTEEEMTALREGRVTAQMLLEKAAVALDIDVAEISKVAGPSVRVTRDVSERKQDEAVPAGLEISGVAEEKARVDADIDEARESEDESVFEEFVVDEGIRTIEELRIEDVKAVEEVKVADKRPVVIDKPEAVAEEISRYPEDIVEKDDLLVPRIEMQSWQDEVDTIRTVIAECPDCIVVKKDADGLATSMAAYTGTKVKEIIDRPRLREEITLEVAKEKLPLEADISVEAKPEVAEVEITATARVEEKEVDAEVLSRPSPPEEREVEAESPKTPVSPIEKEDKLAKPEAVSRSEETSPDVVAEPSKEPTKLPAIAERVETLEVPVKEKDEEEEKYLADVVQKETSPPKDERKTEAVPAGEIKKTIEEEKETVEVEMQPTAEKEIVRKEEPLLKEEKVKEVPILEKEQAKEAVPREEAVKGKVAEPVTEEKTVPEVSIPAPEEAPVPIPQEEEVKEVPVSKEAPISVPQKEEVKEVAIPVPMEEEMKEIPVSIEEEEVVKEVSVPMSIEKEEEVQEVPVSVPIEEKVREVPISVPIEEEVREIAVSVPIEDKEIKEVPVEEEVVPIEEKEVKEVPVEEEVVPTEEEKEEPEVTEEIAVEILPEVGEEFEKEPIEVKEEEEEIEVSVDVKEKVPEEDKIDVDVEILPEEEVEVEPKEIEEEKPIEEELLEEPRVPVLEEPKVVPEVPEEEYEIPCTCIPSVPSKPVKKTKVVQTEITRIETIQVITQTVTDVETQTTPRAIKQPKLVTVTKAVDPDSETMRRLLSYRQPQPTTMTFAHSSQTLKTSTLQATTMDMDAHPAQHPLSTILQSLRTEAVQMKPEQELRSIHYGKKPEEPEKCNCCQCGKEMPASRTRMEDPPTSMFKILAGSSMPRKIVSPSVQPETCFCPECKIKKLQETLKAHDPLKKVSKKDTRDQEVCTCPSQPVKRHPPSKLRKRSDQGCMARISKAKADKTPKREVERAEDRDSLGCVCSGLIETSKPGVMKKVHCTCGDPD